MSTVAASIGCWYRKLPICLYERAAMLLLLRRVSGSCKHSRFVQSLKVCLQLHVFVFQLIFYLICAAINNPALAAVSALLLLHLTSAAAMAHGASALPAAMRAAVVSSPDTLAVQAGQPLPAMGPSEVRSGRERMAPRRSCGVEVDLWRQLDRVFRLSVHHRTAF